MTRRPAPMRWRIGPVSAVLFDLDGVLVHSQTAIDWSMTAWAMERRLDPALVLSLAYGRRDADTVGRVLPERDPVPELARIAELDFQALHMVRAVPGAAALVSTLPVGTWAVVTSGSRDIVRARLRAVGLPAPPLLVAADDVTAGKPDPEGYLTAARRLGIRPDDCVVFEDSEPGLCAARRAGTWTVGVGREVPVGSDGRCDAWVRDLAGVEVELAAKTLVLTGAGNLEEGD